MCLHSLRHPSSYKHLVGEEIAFFCPFWPIMMDVSLCVVTEFGKACHGAVKKSLSLSPRTGKEEGE